jgi:hypothetical protein
MIITAKVATTPKKAGCGRSELADEAQAAQVHSREEENKKIRTECVNIPKAKHAGRDKGCKGRYSRARGVYGCGV